MADAFLTIETGLIDIRMDGLNDSINRFKDNQLQLEYRLERREVGLLSQFNAMDAIVAQMRSTGDYLTAQLSNLVGTYQKD